MRIVLSVTALLLASCVGDDSVQLDAGKDATEDAATNDAASIDASGDATDAGNGCVAPGASVLAWWTGDDTLADKTGVFNLTATTPSYDTGVVGDGFKGFDLNTAPSIKSATPTAFEGNAQLTVEAWIKPSSYPSSVGRFVDFDSNNNGSNLGWGLYLDATGHVTFYVHNAGTITSASQVPLGVFRHVAGVFDGGKTLTVYVAGAIDGSTSTLAATTPAIAATNVYMRIGYSADNVRDLFTGDVDEVTVYGRALSATEIQAISDAGAVGKCKN